MSFFLLFLFFLAPTSLSLRTDFFFNGTVTCNLKQPFMYKINVVEKDFVLWDDLISQSSFQIALTSPAHYEVAAIDWGDGPFDPTYEIKYEVFHDCSSVYIRDNLRFEIQVGNFKVVDGTIYHTFDFTLDDKGRIRS